MSDAAAPEPKSLLDMGFENWIPCRVKTLSPGEQEKADEAARTINPMNFPAHDTESLLAVVTTNYWGPYGVRLTVGFLDEADRKLRDKVLFNMNAWSEHCNVKFTESKNATEAQVRITFKQSGKDAGHWSFLGTEILGKGPNEATMNLEIDSNTTDRELRRVIRHETGHTLGFPHEHLRPELQQYLDEAKVIEYYQEKQGWDKKETMDQIFEKLPGEGFIATGEAFRDSIMCYPFPAFLTTNNEDIVGGVDITIADAKFAGAIYPKPRHEEITAWDEVDNVPTTDQLIAVDGALYRRHGGEISEWMGKAGEWRLLGTDSRTTQMTADNYGLYRLLYIEESIHVEIYDGTPLSGWKPIFPKTSPRETKILSLNGIPFIWDPNSTPFLVFTGGRRSGGILRITFPQIKRIHEVASSGLELYCREEGKIVLHKGLEQGEQNNMGQVLPDDSDPDIAEIVALPGRLYKRQHTGPIYVYAGTDWTKIDDNPDTVQIITDGAKLYQRRTPGFIFVYTGTPRTGWEQIDKKNQDMKSIMGGGGTIYRRLRDDTVHVYNPKTN